MDEKEIEKLMEQYKDIEVPEGLFDLDEVFKKGDIIIKRRKIIKYTVRVAAVFIIAVIIALILLLKPKNPNEVVQQSEAPTEIENVSYQKEIEAKNMSFVWNQINHINKVYSIKQTEILEYSSIIKDNYIYPITKVKAEVLNTFSGEELGEITFWIPGGIWTVQELKNTQYYYDEKDIENLNDNDNIYVKYYEQIKIAKPEVEKIYFVTLKEENGELYVETNAKYGFKEYNPDTNCILNANNEWELVNIEEYLK